jgi:glycosyltransferase involved in cell wall biosynthesis
MRSEAQTATQPTRAFRLLSMVEALTVTGPMKPLLMFSSMARNGIGSWRRLDHRIVTTRRPAAAHGRRDLLKEAAESAGVDFVTIPERFVGDLRVLSVALRYIRQYRPDVIETHDNKSHFLLFLLRALHRDIREIAWVAFHHGYTRTSIKVRLYQQLDRLTLRFATRVNTLCKPFAAELASRGVARERISILTNTVEKRDAPAADRAAEARASAGATAGECLLLTVGRLSKEKGHEDLIEAFTAAQRMTSSRLRLVIAGDGPERERLEALARRVGANVVFLGHVADPWPLYNVADIFVLPSHSEGSPLVLLEAMAASVAIVATAVGGVPEVLTDERTGFLVPPHGVSQLSARIVALAEDPGLRKRLGDAANEELSRHSPEKYAAAVIDIYGKALAAGNRGHG